MKIATDFERFFKENYMALHYYTLKLTSEEEVSRDIVADAFEHLWKVISQGEKVEDWHAYIYAYVQHKCVDFLRHTLVKEKYIDFYLRTNNEEYNTEDTDERLEAIQAILDTLPPRTRLVLQECYIHKKKYKEVAEELDISINAVKQHIVKALQTIRKKVKI